MQSQSLNGFWQVRQVGSQDWFPASVPGSVHTDLMAAGKLPDPFLGTNEEKVQWVAEKSWEYRKYFYPLPGIFRQEKIWLVCAGLDTLAEVRLNGKILGQADNMYRTWRWEIKDHLQEGENKLEILFRSPVGYIKTRERLRRVQGMEMGIRGGQHMRKTPSHFGWDWGPRLPSIGIWQQISLESANRGRLGEVRFDQEHNPGVVSLTARVQADLWDPGESRYMLRLRITGPEREVWLLDAPARSQAAMTVTITNPQLWWPNGYGAQPLYTAEIELLGPEEEIVDARAYTIGLRDVSLQQVDDEYGRSFQFVVNGVKVLCKGSNWIPADSFPARVTPERVEALVRAAAETHQNMLRIWGGGYYENDTFYDLCDRYGILVWQDFMFACGVYPLDDPAYLENVRAEVIENVRRLRHHASLAVWCGNNEIEQLGTALGWFRKADARETYARFFFRDLPAVLAEEDPCRPYWPGSPSSNDPFKEPCAENRGDAHLWEVFSEFYPPRHYRKQNPRFVSEFGFQGFPAQATVEEFCPPEARTVDSAVMRMHQRALGGNDKLIWYLAQRFRLPQTLEGIIYLSQVFQAEAVRLGIEHWRRHPDQTSGMLYWQLNDCWPVISWASIDYNGRWKALHYTARRFFAPVLLSLEERVEKRQRQVDVWVSNDSLSAWDGRVHWTLETLEGEVVEGGNQPVTCPPQSAGCALKLNFARHNGKVDWSRLVFVAELWQGTQRQGLQVVTFVPEKSMPAVKPEIQAEIDAAGERLSIRLTSRRTARFVQLWLDGIDVQFSDNFFDLPAGRSVTVECALPEGWSPEQVQQALRVRSLNEAGPCDSLVASHWKGDVAMLSALGDLAWNGFISPRIRRR
jgi:beta-mannosidase